MLHRAVDEQPGIAALRGQRRRHGRERAQAKAGSERHRGALGGAAPVVEVEDL
jgi:hypothetical protein